MSDSIANARKYKKIDYATRKIIINQVLSDGKNIHQISQKHQISPSTIRAIVRMYQDKGTIFETKRQKQIRQITEKFKKEQQENVEPPNSSEPGIKYVYYQPFYIPYGMNIQNTIVFPWSL